jgi:hypothetical protein
VPSAASGHLQGAIADLPAETADDGLDQLFDVLEALAQRRHADLDDVDVVEQVLAELAFGDQSRQVPVGRRQDAHVDRHLLALADRPHALLLDDAQEVDLHVHRQVSDLIQERRAALKTKSSKSPPKKTKRAAAQAEASAPVVNAAAKIEREVRNCVKRPREGGLCAAVWEDLDSCMRAVRLPRLSRSATARLRAAGRRTMRFAS